MSDMSDQSGGYDDPAQDPIPETPEDVAADEYEPPPETPEDLASELSADEAELNRSMPPGD
jgi:hypothetical protein